MAKMDDDRCTCCECFYFVDNGRGPMGWGLCHANPPTMVISADGSPKSWRPSTKADAVVCRYFEDREQID